MKKKFLILTLCFTLIFTSFNYKKSYADGGIVSLPILATVSALAVGTGIVINNSDDLYDLGHMFYNYVKNHNSLTWSVVSSAFSAGCTVMGNKLVSVDSNFLDIVKGFFDSTFDTEYSDSVIPIGSIGSLPLYGNFTLDISDHLENTIDIGDSTLSFQCSPDSKSYYIKAFCGDVQYISHSAYYNQSVTSKFCSNFGHIVQGYSYNPSSGKVDFKIFNGSRLRILSASLKLSAVSLGTFPYNGGYTWDNVEDRLNENNELPLPIPGNLGSLVGQGSTDFWDNTDDLVGNGDISVPSVDNPSIGIGGSTTFPGTVTDSPSTSVPSEGIWSAIKDFIISLVVPSDSYWTDTWGGLYGSFTNSFPGVDMSNFNDLIVNGKKFPNIDIDIMGVKGRVVNGDVCNSIVDWLRPIVAGFMMLCLMFFNYRKIYKLIRNSEPFPGIAQGTSDFKTGISEYNWRENHVDIHAEYQAYKEARK